MTNNLLNLQISDHAHIQHATLGADDRRRVDAWFDHLRNWNNDEFLRSKARRLEMDDEIFVLDTSAGMTIAFKINTNDVIVVSIFRKEALSSFKAMAEQPS